MIQRLVRWMEHLPVAVWRWVAVAYYIVLSTGTHWPSLRFGHPGPIPIDKVLHMTAFCGLTGLLMLSRFLDWNASRAFVQRNIWRCASVALVIAAIDELTQALPGEDRFPGWDDYAADALGITIAVLAAMFIFRRVTVSSPRA